MLEDYGQKMKEERAKLADTGKYFHNSSFGMEDFLKLDMYDSQKQKLAKTKYRRKSCVNECFGGQSKK